MAHTYTQLLTHAIFSTKERLPVLNDVLRPRLFAYMGGIIREIGGKALTINGPVDHIHLLLSLPARIALADAIRIVKSNSSRWVHEELRRPFEWQAGYGAFTVGFAEIASVKEYIRNQEEHHRVVSFQEKFLDFLHRNGVEYDERYIWE